MSDLQELTSKIVKFRDKRGWDKQDGKENAKNMAISLLIEATELLGLFQWRKDNKLPKKKREEFEGELIDVLYWVLLIAHDFKIDIKKAFIKKMKKNKIKYPA
ncbi:MazG-like family protein [Patescibacteria group bacterium]